MFKSLELWALIISFLAIVISIYTWYKSYKIDKDRRIDEEREQNSAVLTAQLERLRKGMGVITIENIGESEARNVQIKLDGIPLVDCENISHSSEYSLIGPQSYIQYKVNVSFDKPAVELIEINWDDDHESGKTYRNSLSY